MKVCGKMFRTDKNAVILLVLALTVIAPTRRVFAQGMQSAGNDTVALVDGKPITASEFKERFELTIYPNKGGKARLQIEKERFLFSLVAERLLSDEWIKSGKSVTPHEKELRLEATQTYLRDALYRKEVVNQLNVTDSDVMNGIEKALQKYFIRIYYFPDSSMAASFYNECARLGRARIDSVVSARRVPTDTVHVIYGELVKPQEDVIWGRHKGFMSKPVHARGVFAVIRILARQHDTDFSRLTPQEKEARVRDIIRTRREAAMTRKFAASVLGNVRATATSPLVAILADSISYELKRQEPSRSDMYYNLTTGEIGDLLQRFRNKEKLPVIRLRWTDNSRKETSMSLGEVIRNLRSAEFLSKGTSPKDVYAGLKDAFPRVMGYSILANEAERLGLEHSEEVQKNVNLIMTAYFASQMREAVADTVRVSRADIDRFIHEYNSSDMRDIRLTLQEFHARTIDEALSAYNVVNTLDSMGRAMRESIMHQMNVDTVTSNAFMLGEIGSIFSRLEPGRTYGPIRKHDSYTLYRLVSRVRSVPDTASPLPPDLAKTMALKEKQAGVLCRYVSSLASQSDVRIFLGTLKKVNVDPVQSFAVRQIGFGGTVSAAPPLDVCEDWTRYAPMNEIIVP